jgi:adenylate cyclase
VNPKPPPGQADAFWRDYLTRGHPAERAARKFLIRLPRDPRCTVCAAPFGGPAAPIMRLIGKRQSDKSPNICNGCYTFLADHHGGAEIECTMLFADIRGSTTLAEGMSTAEYHAVLDRFYSVASRVVFNHDGAVDKFVGDELVAFFYQLLTGERHAVAGVDAARELLVATGHGDPAGPWVPVGAGVHTGLVWMGAIGEGAHVELTAVGDAVNVTARLASAALAGEILVTHEAATAAGLDPGLERRSLVLKGKQATTDVVSLRVDAEPANRV